jgi:hypothetical protein
VRSGDLLGHLRRRRGQHALELVGDSGMRGARRRSDEHRPERRRRRSRDVEQREVEPRRTRSGPPRPGLVDGEALGLAQHVERPDELHQRRDRETRAQQVVLPEAIPDHRFSLRRIRSGFHLPRARVRAWEQ